MPGGIGVWEIVILLLVALLIFGPRRLPEIGRSLGSGMREFKDSVMGTAEIEDSLEPPAPGFDGTGRRPAES